MIRPPADEDPSPPGFPDPPFPGPTIFLVFRKIFFPPPELPFPADEDDEDFLDPDFLLDFELVADEANEATEADSLTPEAAG